MKTRHNTCFDHHHDVLIIGAGMAGLSVALSLPAHYRITLLAKDGLPNCASSRAQGGMAAVMDEHDSFAEHEADTHIAGAGQCVAQSVCHMVRHAPDAIHWLCALGVPFSQSQGHLHLTREGGHSHRRIVHAADHTGLSMTETLQHRLQQHDNITLLPQHQASALLMQAGRCVGARIHTRAGQAFDCYAHHTVLASGGLGQLFELTTNPTTATGEGVALAALAGCRVRHLAYVQFHPTALALAAQPGFLISEAVRGEGGLLRNAQGERFMPRYDERAELAPRDIVARAIAQQRAHGEDVFLDMSQMSADLIETQFPSILAHCLSLGLDIRTTPIPVAPAAHYACGGVLTDCAGHTDVAHLYAVGEVACTGLHGANRLASNSLLECVVMGRTVATDIVANHSQWPRAQPFADARLWQDVWAQTKTAAGCPVHADDMSTLPQQMSRYFGICRSHEGMCTLYRWLQQKYVSMPDNAARLPWVSALLMVYDGLQQTANHGTHYNLDLLPNQPT